MSLLGSRAVIVAAAALGLGLIGYALFSRPTDEERIAEVLHEIEEAVGFESPPNPLTHAANLRGRFVELVTPEVVVDLPERGLVARGRDDLTRLAVAGTTRMQRFDVAFTVEEIEVAGNSAKASVEVITEATLGGDPRLSTRRADLQFLKSDDDWQLASAHVIEGDGD